MEPYSQIDAKTYYFIFPFKYDNSHVKRINDICDILDTGAKLFFEIYKGAYKGSIGELDITSDQLRELYPTVKNLEYNTKFFDSKFQLKFDNGKRLSFHQYKDCGRFRTKNVNGTVWNYTKKSKTPSNFKLYDHLGTELFVGSYVMFMHGFGNSYEIRFGQIDRITAAGTIYVRAYKTRDIHKEEIFRYGISGKDMILLEGDMKQKIMLERLKRT